MIKTYTGKTGLNPNMKILSYYLYSLFSNEDPCAIILACSLLTKSDSDIRTSDSKTLRTKFEDDFSLGANDYLDSSNQNDVVNKTVGYITQLCNTANVQR